VRTLVVFEDSGVGAFDLLCAVRGVFDLRCGAQTLLERFVTACAADRVVLIARSEVGDLLRESHADMTIGWPKEPHRGSGSKLAPDGDVLFVNGRLLALGDDLQRLLSADASRAVTDRDVLVTARCGAEQAELLVSHLERLLQTGATGESTVDFLRREVEAIALHAIDERDVAPRNGSALLEHAWDLVRFNGAALLDDFERGPGAAIADNARIDSGAHLMQIDAIHIAPGARVRPGVVLDAEEGPITLDLNADVQPQAVLRGPVYVGPNSLVKAGARIHRYTSLGPVCRIGGEVGNSVVQGYSNKQHDGFMGHAYLAEWVNLGADTNNSNLKNNYGNVRMWESGRFIDTGLTFIGLIAADHLKTAINTQLNTGTVVGISSQIFGAGFPPKYIPPFSWGGAERIETYDLERALHTARVVMERRKRELTPAYEAAFRLAYARASKNPPAG
jgi:UDP-N-acetylglucosamine diphosphorylase/glucosamine-1-phosphate N-acetyltransferase